jgi:DNA polymerase-3 subunit alpha
VSAAKYGLSNFSAIPETPVVVGTSVRKIKDKNTGETKDSVWDRYQLHRIAGAVLDKNKNKHSLTLLTTDGVVTVKFYAEAFAHYDKQVSNVDPETGKKNVLEKSWFSRGNKLLITGIRRGDTFFPKKYVDSIYQHTVCLITAISDNGDIAMTLERQRT